MKERETRTARRLVAIALLALGPASCRGCGCTEGTRTFEKLDGKVPVSLIRKTHWAGGKLPGPISDFYLHVETTPPFDEPITCDHVDMAEDDAGKNVGYRCKGTKEWTVLRLRGGDRRIRECNAPVGTADTPRFEKLEPVRTSAGRILACESVASSYTMKELVHATFEDEGSNAGADLAVELATHGQPARAGEVDGWDFAASVLDEPGKARALAGLCAVLANGTPSHAAYVRAAMRCSLDGPAIAATALAKLRAILADKKLEPAVAEDYTQDLALRWSGLIAGATLAKETGSEVCAAIGDTARAVGDNKRAALALLLAHTSTSCPSLDAWLRPGPCNFMLDCDGGLCTSAELAADREGWNGALDGGRRETLPLPRYERAVLAAAYLRGPLPQSLVLPNARRRYPVADAGSDLPSCDDQELDSGVSCDCRLHPLDVCKAPLEGKDPVWHKGYCSIRVDDTHRMLRDVRRQCANEGTRCGQNDWCCPSLTCTAGTCMKKTKPDAAIPSDAGQ